MLCLPLLLLSSLHILSINLMLYVLFFFFNRDVRNNTFEPLPFPSWISSFDSLATLYENFPYLFSSF